MLKCVTYVLYTRWFQGMIIHVVINVWMKDLSMDFGRNQEWYCEETLDLHSWGDSELIRADNLKLIVSLPQKVIPILIFHFHSHRTNTHCRNRLYLSMTSSYRCRIWIQSDPVFKHESRSLYYMRQSLISYIKDRSRALNSQGNSEEGP